MVRKARTKFLIFTLIGIFVFCACVLLVIRTGLKNSAEHEIANKLTEIENFHEQEVTTFSYDHFVCYVTSYDSQTGEFILKTEKAVGFSQEDIQNFVSSALSRNYPLGSIGNVYYKITYAGNVPQCIVSADFSYVLLAYYDNINSALFTLTIIFAIVGVLVWLFSFWVFKPVEETLFKQRQFISDVSHELKTPIAIIMANADVLNRTSETEYSSNIQSQSKRMGLLVNDLLTLSSLDEGNTNVKKQVFSASETVLKTLLPFDALAFETGKFLVFEIDEKLFVKGIPEDLSKICDVLIDNAVKYATKGTEIKVSLKRDGNKIRLSVFNNGCNVYTEDKDRIFERFYRADTSRSRDKGGSGLGLSIAKSLAKRNNWKISANPKHGESMEIVLVMKEKQELDK